MVRKKNVLATVMQSFAITCLVTVLWMVVGYSMAFGTANAYIGDLSRVLGGMDIERALHAGRGTSAPAPHDPGDRSS